MDELIPKVTIELRRSDAVVLFDWLTSTDLNDVPADHPAGKQALTDLLSRLEETAIPGYGVRPPRSHWGRDRRRTSRRVSGHAGW